MNDYPLVTVNIPAFNEEGYIALALEALARQTYPNFEVVVVDNCSTDHTVYVVNSFAFLHPEMDVRLISEGRQGTQHARERGRLVARGVILAQLDADCVPPPNWIMKGVNSLLKHDAVAVAGPYRFSEAPLRIRMLTFLSQAIILRGLNAVLGWTKKGGVIIGGNVFIRAEVLAESGGFNTNLSFYGDDTDLAVQLSKFGAIRFTMRTWVRSSYRRYLAQGFRKVQRRYNQVFFRTIAFGGIHHQDSIELVHPR